MLTAINIRTTVFWDVTPYSLEHHFKSFQNSALGENMFKSSSLAARLQTGALSDAVHRLPKYPTV